MYCGKCNSNFKTSFEAMSHMSSHGHLITEIDQWLRLPSESRPELTLEPFHYSLLNVLFIDFNQNKQGGQCWACGAAFGTYQDLMHHFKDNGHDRILINRIEKLLRSADDQRQMRQRPARRQCFICQGESQGYNEQDILEHVQSEKHKKMERDMLKFQLNEETFTTEFCEKFLTRQISISHNDDLASTLNDLGDSVSNAGDGNNVGDTGPEFAQRIDIQPPPGFVSLDGSGSYCSKSTTDRTGRLHNEAMPKPAVFDSATTISSGEGSSSGYSSTHLSYPSSAPISWPKKPPVPRDCIRKEYDKMIKQYIWICDVCKKNMTGETPLRQHLQGEVHLKNVRDLELGVQDLGNNFRCDTCNILVNGVDNWNQHIQGKAHKRRVQLSSFTQPSTQQIIQSEPAGSEIADSFTFVSGSSSVAGSSSDAGSARSPGFNQMNFNIQPTNEISRNKTSCASPHHQQQIISVVSGNCPYCSQRFRTQKELDSHVKTPGHQNKVRAAKSETVVKFVRSCSVGGTTRCPVCGQSIDNLSRLDVHLGSREHVLAFGDSECVDCLVCGVSVCKSGHSAHLQSGVHQALKEAVVREIRSRFSQSQSETQSVSNHSAASGDRRSFNDMDRDSNYCMDRFQREGNRYKTDESTKSGDRVKKEPSEASVSTFESGAVLGDINYNYCEVCKLELSSTKVALDHYKGKKHMKQKMKTGSSDDSQSIFGGSVVSSSSAGSLMNARQFVKSCEVPELSEESLEDYYETVQMVKDVPRFYQHDLYRRIMADDSAYFCYLPTGMGKTLIACLVLSKMLELNPDRCFAYFVTDKILLAIQQMEYIRKQFADGVSQHLKIGALCGTEMMLAEGLNDPTKHNILVVTAEYLKNRLENRALKWQAACCVIFDEVHHCDLKHPYNNLIKTFHTIAVTTPVFPKLIGLTASPAIKDTGKSTFELLLDRLRQFGEAKLVTASPEDINKHRVIPEVDFHARAPLPECQDFAKKVGQIVQTFLMENQPFLNALPRRLKTLLQDGNDEMNRNYNITIECEKFLEGVTQPSIEKGVQIVLRLVEVIFLARIVNLYEAEVCLEGIMPEEGLGIKTNYTCRMIISVLQEFREQTEQNLALQSDVTPYSALLEEIEKTFPDKESKDKNIFLLILVRTRCDALALTKIMQKEPRLMKLRLEVDCVVGHGGNASTSGVKGMNVKKQFKTLHAIPDKHILVATSVAEEGIDIPGCEKVIMFEAPKDTTAFVQIKGRARKQQSTVILIGPPSEQAKLHNLIHSEKYMLEAVQHMDNQTIPQQIGFN